MTIQEAQTKIQEIQARTDIGSGQKSAMTMRVVSQCRRDNPGIEASDLA